MKIRLLAVLGAALAVMAFAPAASAAAVPHPARQSVPRADLIDDATVYTFCLNSQTDECLNQTNCDTAKSVQLWDVTAGGACTDDWDVTFAGNIPTSGGGSPWPFWCGDDFNAKYAGDAVFQLVYSPPGGSVYVPDSLGGSNSVNLTVLGGDYQGYWVATGDTTDTELVDVATSCNTGTVQYVYAGCKGNGCLVRESTGPTSLLFWEWYVLNP